MINLDFRGLDYNGNWVYGLPYYTHGGGEWFISHSNGWQPSYSNPDEGETTELTRVDPNSIGQYIGRDDMRGVKVYDGDILDFDESMRNSRHTPELIKRQSNGEYNLSDPIEDISLWRIVIGNNIQNPELLETEYVRYHNYDGYELSNIDEVKEYVKEGIHEEFEHNISNVDVVEVIELISWNGKKYRFTVSNFENDGHGHIHDYSLKVEYEIITEGDSTNV